MSIRLVQANRAVASEEVFDRARALEMTEGDEELLNDLILLFKQESASLLEQVESSTRIGDADAIRKAAHRLKGAAATVGAEQVAGSARLLETMGAMGKMSGIEQVISQLREYIVEYFAAVENAMKESH